MRRSLAAGSAALAAWSVTDAARRGDFVWDTAGRSKGRWIAVQILVPLAGPLLYLTRVRPGLVAAEQALAVQGG